MTREKGCIPVFSRMKNKGRCEVNWGINMVHSGPVVHVIRKNTNEALIIQCPVYSRKLGPRVVSVVSFCRLEAFHKCSFKFNVSLTG